MPWKDINMGIILNLAFLALCGISFSITSQHYSWAVIGAGPAGITGVAVLLEKNVPDNSIAWIDPKFNSGRLEYYGNVPSNQPAARITSYLSKCTLYNHINTPARKAVADYDQHSEPPLQLLSDIMLDITNYLVPYVSCYVDNVVSVTQSDGVWIVAMKEKTITAYNVILATGSHPKKLELVGPQEIPLDRALDEKKLKNLVLTTDTVMVVGSAHSALLVLKYLTEIPVKHAISIYTHAPRYGSLGGLEGITARWTAEILEKNQPDSVSRILYDPATIVHYAQRCDKIIYAFGYERNPLVINGSTNFSFDEETGEIAPHLYGIGIAFPVTLPGDDGKRIPLIGINSFIEYAQTFIPKWIDRSSHITMTC